ncbi:MAG: response regulator transcription factor [Deltaproteobacteria bacterium]|nr:response regulator transcription factor [Deltaproteobacteria bacterium]
MNFEYKGFRVLTAATGDEGMKKAFDARPDLIILDIILPGPSGLEILSALRSRDRMVPVLILSARDTTDHKIEGLNLGADDYLTKPFELPELLARAEAMLRRRTYDEPVLTVGDVTIDPVKRTVTLGSEPVELTAREFDLLLLLARAPGRPFSRDAIIDRVWGWGFSGTNRTVDNCILALRQKIEADPVRPRYILTVRQVGYKLEP